MHHIRGDIFGFDVNIDTLYFSWACMILILALAAWLASGHTTDMDKYGLRQHISESLFNFFRGLTNNQIGTKHGDKFTSLIGAIFIFILVSYYAGLLPWKMGHMFSWWPKVESHHKLAPAHPADDHIAETLNEDLGLARHHAKKVINKLKGGSTKVPKRDIDIEHRINTTHTHAEKHHDEYWHGASPAADMNVAAGLALLVVLVYFAAGTSIAGFKYVQMYLPLNFSKKGVRLNLMCLLELMDLAIRPLTLSLRLFANTVAGETLLATFISLAALVIPIAILGFEMAVGVLQSFLFAILASVYIGTSVQHAEHLLHDEHH